MSDEAQKLKMNDPSPTVESWSIEQDADHLMDDLFANVDVLLEGGQQLPNQPVQLAADPSPSVPVTAAPVDSAPMAAPKKRRTLRTRRKASPAASQKPITWGVRLRAWRTQIAPHWDKVFFGLACVALGGSVAWLVQQQRWATVSEPSGQGPAGSNVTVQPLPPEDAQFAEYMLRSLRVIARQEPKRSLTAASSTTAMANRSVAGNEGSPQVIERIYIPVYPPNSADNQNTNNAIPRVREVPSSRLPASNPPASPSNNASSGAANTTPTPNAPPSPPAVPRLNLPSQDTAARRSERGIPSLPSLDALPPLDLPDNNPPTPLPPGDNRLVGVVQSGDRATAIFKVGETTQRIGLGEAIGQSGWTLVSVDGQGAVIRRNGEFRSVYVTQTF